MSTRRRTRFLSGDERGNITLLAALVLPFVAVMAGFAVDAALLERQDQRLQNIADAAAFAGVVAIESRVAVRNSSERDRRVEEAVLATASSMGHVGAGKSVKYSTITGDDGESGVAVELRAEPELVFQPLYRGRVGRLEAKSSAIMQRTAPVCVLALNANAPAAVSITGARSVELQGCAVQSNSDAADAVLLTNTNLKAKDICAVGGDAQSGRVVVSPGVKTECEPFEDPLRFVNPPIASGCDETGYVVGAGQSVTLSPGRYCAGLRIEAGAAVTMDDGAYVMRDGPLVIENGARVEGEAVTVLLAGTNAFVDIVGQSTFRLAAPVSGPYAGLAIYRQPLATPGAVLTSHIQGTATEGVEGTIYLPDQRLVLVGGAANRDPALYTMLIADTVSIKGRRDVRIRFDLDTSQVPWAAPTYFAGGVRLIR